MSERDSTAENTEASKPIEIFPERRVISTIDLARKSEDDLEFAVSRGRFDLITKENFPEKSDIELAYYQLFAEDNKIDPLQTAKSTTNSLEAKEILNLHIAARINERERRFVDALKSIPLPEGVTEHTKIAAQNIFRLDPVVASSLHFAIENGLYEQISDRNIAALRALNDEELRRLKRRAIRNRIRLINEEIKEHRSVVGFGNSKSNDNSPTEMEEEIEFLRGIYYSLRQKRLTDTTT